MIDELNHIIIFEPKHLKKQVREHLENDRMNTYEIELVNIANELGRAVEDLIERKGYSAIFRNGNRTKILKYNV